MGCPQISSTPLCVTGVADAYRCGRTCGSAMSEKSVSQTLADVRRRGLHISYRPRRIGAESGETRRTHRNERLSQPENGGPLPGGDLENCERRRGCLNGPEGRSPEVARLG